MHEWEKNDWGERVSVAKGSRDLVTPNMKNAEALNTLFTTLFANKAICWRSLRTHRHREISKGDSPLEDGDKARE